MFNKININSQRQKLIVYVILTLAALAVYRQVHQYSFINFDDIGYVTQYSNIQSGITNGFPWAFGTRYADLWNPLVWLSFMFDYQLYGLNAGGYHVTNLILHILSTLLLFWLFNRMTGAVWQSAFVAAIFALHPLHVESVAWISQRKDVLSAFFWMLTLCLYVYYTEKPAIKRYLLVVFCFVCALMQAYGCHFACDSYSSGLLAAEPSWSRKTAATEASKDPENISIASNKEKKKNKANKVAIKKTYPHPMRKNYRKQKLRE